MHIATLYHGRGSREQLLGRSNLANSMSIPKLRYSLPTKAMVLNLWVVIPLEVTGVIHQIPSISDFYIMIHYSSKIRVMK